MPRRVTRRVARNACRLRLWGGRLLAAAIEALWPWARMQRPMRGLLCLLCLLGLLGLQLSRAEQLDAGGV